MITGELKSKIDRVWDAFWSGGISNSLAVIEQITYLLFIRRLDDIQTLAEKKARVTKTYVENPVSLPGQADLRWGQFKNASTPRADLAYLLATSARDLIDNPPSMPSIMRRGYPSERH